MPADPLPASLTAESTGRPLPAVGAVARRRSPMTSPASARLLFVGGVLAVLWAAVGWALGWYGV